MGPLEYFAIFLTLLKYSHAYLPYVNINELGPQLVDPLIQTRSYKSCKKGKNEQSDIEGAAQRQNP